MIKKLSYVFVLTTLGCFLAQTTSGADLTDATYLAKRGPKRPLDPDIKLVGGKVIVGKQPDGYGSVETLDRNQKESIFVCYIAAKDDLGIAILDLKKGDKVEVLSADGWGEFSGNKGALIESIVGLVTDAASIAAAASGSPEADPFIKKGGDYAAKVFKKLGDSDPRDAHGKDHDGETKRQEGGVLICMPEAGGVYYSGSDKKRWVKGKDGGERTDDRLPDHIHGHGVFFPFKATRLIIHVPHKVMAFSISSLGILITRTIQVTTG